MKKNLLRLSFIASIAISTINLSAQNTKRALFLGNSYTYYNNLPQLTSDVALSVGDTLIVDSNTPGGTSFSDHVTNPTSLALIGEGGWDYVILQEQSQMPSFPIGQVEQDVFPFATQLNDLILTDNPCAETMFYMTWGREEGDASNCAFWPPVCTYEGMDDLLRERYVMMAEMNEAEVSPVGAVWRHIRENYPDINLYASDGSHPSPEGSYAAAVCFYTSIFKKNPQLITFNYTIDDAVETIIKNTVESVVFNAQSTWYHGAYLPAASLNVQVVSDLNYSFENTSMYANEYYIGIDGQYQAFTDEFNYTFPAAGQYTVSIIASQCGVSDTNEYIVNAGVSNVLNIQQEEMMIYPNPANGFVMLDMAGQVGTANVMIFDITGSCVKQINCNKGESISIDELSAGVYTLQCNMTTKRYVGTLIIE